MANRTVRSGASRIPIRGLSDRSAVTRVTEAHLSGERKVRALVQYQTDPIGFLVDVLGIPRHTLVWSENAGYEDHAWDGTRDPLVRMLDVLAGKIAGRKHAAVESATGTGKTFTAAAAVLWFLACFEDALVVTTAPKERQLKENLWKEISALLPAFKRRFPLAESIELKIRMRPVIEDPMTGVADRQERWSAVGWTAGVDAGAESAVRSQGFHAEHMLIVVEECPGMDPAILTALKNTATAPHNLILALGNPDNALDPLHQFSELPAVEPIRISAYDHPNVVTGDASLIPGATSRGFVAEKRAEYGETGALYLSRVRGQAPKEAFNGLFRQVDLETAAERWNAIMGRTPEGKPCAVDQALRAQFMAGGTHALGCDPANTPNGDRFALSHWIGAVLLEITKLDCADAYEFGEQIAEIAARDHIQAEHIGVDNVGVGSGTVNYLRRKLTNGMRVRALDGGADDPLAGAQRVDYVSAAHPTGYASDANRFLNRRAQMAWELAQKLRRGTVAIPKHPELWRELLAIRYETEGGVVKLEKKKEIAKRLGRSPDFADAAIYGDHVRAPLPMEETEAAADENRQDRAMPLNLDGARVGHTPARRKSAEDDLNGVFQGAAAVQWRAGRTARPWGRL